MKKLKIVLHQNAISDLDDIWLYTFHNWSKEQADRYLSLIYKEIDFEDKGEKFHFTEKVQALRLEDFEKMMEEAGIYLLDIFGDYKLRKFFKTQSERLIMIFK